MIIKIVFVFSIISLIFAFIIFLFKRNLRRLTKKFGGEVTSKIFGTYYRLEDIDLSYTFGSQSTTGYTSMNVKTLPTILNDIEISPKNTFFKKPKNNDFEELYIYKNANHKNPEFLTNEIKNYLVEAKKCDISLVINKDLFKLTTGNSPFYITKIEQCLSILLKTKKRVNEYELTIDEGL